MGKEEEITMAGERWITKFNTLELHLPLIDLLFFLDIVLQLFQAIHLLLLHRLKRFPCVVDVCPPLPLDQVLLFHLLCLFLVLTALPFLLLWALLHRL